MWSGSARSDGVFAHTRCAVLVGTDSIALGIGPSPLANKFKLLGGNRLSRRAALLRISKTALTGDKLVADSHEYQAGIA